MTQERLKRYLKIKNEILQLQDILDSMEAPIYGLPAQQITDMPTAPSRVGGGSAQERAADRKMELRAWYRAKIAELAEEQLAIEKAIDSLEPVARMLLRCLYIEGVKWRPASDRIGYSRSQANRIHDAALEQLKKEETLCD